MGDGTTPKMFEFGVVMRFRGAVSGAVAAVWDARRQFCRHVGKPFLGTRRPFVLRRFMKDARASFVGGYIATTRRIYSFLSC